MGADAGQQLVPGIVGISTYVDSVYQLEMQRTAAGGSSAERPINRLRSVTVTLDFGRFVEELFAGRAGVVEEQIAQAAEMLAAAGADFIVVTSGTGSTLTARAREQVAIPFLDLAEAAWGELAGSEPVAVGLLSTRRAAAKGNFQSAAERHGTRLLVPSAQTAERVDQVIFNELVLGQVSPRSTQVLRDAINDLVQAGADAVVLGNTDMSVAIQVLCEQTSVRLVDAARAHARAAARMAFRALESADASGVVAR